MADYIWRYSVIQAYRTSVDIHVGHRGISLLEPTDRVIRTSIHAFNIHSLASKPYFIPTILGPGMMRLAPRSGGGLVWLQLRFSPQGAKTSLFDEEPEKCGVGKIQARGIHRFRTLRPTALPRQLGPINIPPYIQILLLAVFSIWNGNESQRHCLLMKI